MVLKARKELVKIDRKTSFLKRQEEKLRLV
jgi:hypothetical protein